MSQNDSASDSSKSWSEGKSSAVDHAGWDLRLLWVPCFLVDESRDAKLSRSRQAREWELREKTKAFCGSKAIRKSSARQVLMWRGSNL